MRKSPAGSRKRSETPSPKSIKRSWAARARSTSTPTWGRPWSSPSSGSIGCSWPGIGDSRAYRLRDGRLEQLTKDHSLADALLDAGTITAEELPTHKFKNVLYLYLGSKDARGGPEDVRVLDVRPGDRLLMASDGLTGVVSDKDLATVLGTVDDPQKAAVELKNMALANDSKDNVTCLIIHAVAEQDSVERDSGRPRLVEAVPKSLAGRPRRRPN